MRALRVSIALLVLLILNSVCVAGGLRQIFDVYKHKDIELCFEQKSINGMSGQTIEKKGRLKIVANEKLMFSYKNERLVIDNFKAIDYRDNKTQVYKLSGFEKVLFLMFIGKKDLNELFRTEELDNNTYRLYPKYQSNIDSVVVRLDNGTVRELTISDIYANRTIYTFYAPDSCRAFR
ncbi:outer-membrane lipoprotein carrier protein LolA [Hippea sp. KM1]|uniref:outer-membrane lipoprotein carrier protein LolA n=1 Tax=Hippea sp. KM1 TaxID=944481 RepID=UPI00046D56B2|nr:outer-membrane lipoprotein carrier protein LolA [Hippea sp. KM1]